MHRASPPSPHERTRVEAPVPADLAELIRRYPDSPPIDLLPEIHRHHAEAVACERESVGPQAAAAALRASLACDLVARSYLDLGDPRAALAQTDTALFYADRAGSHGALIRHRALQSLAAYWAGWPREALRYARLGRNATRPTGSALGTLMAVQARSYALLGNSIAARDALVGSNAAMDTAVPDELDLIGGELHFSEARRKYFEAEARVHIAGGSRAAAQCAQTAIRLYNEASQTIETSSTDAPPTAEAAAATAVLALAQARQEQLDGVRETLDGLLALAPAKRTLPVVLSTARVHAELRRPAWVRDPRVRDVQEQIEAFCRVPVSMGA